jgi:PmbA protein
MYNKEFEIIFDYARNLADDIEIMLSSGTSFSVKIHDQEIEAFNYADSKGISVRVIKNGKVGYAYTEKFDEKTFKLIVNEAIENCRYSENNEVVVLENYPDINQKLDVYSEELDKVDIKDKLKFAMNMEKIAKSFDKRVFNVPYSVMGDGKAYVKIANSKGLNKEDKQNYAFAFVSSLTEEKDDKRVGSDFIISRNFKEFNAQRLAENSVKKSVALLGGKEIKSGKYPVVLNNEMTATILATFSGLFSAKAVQEGKSLLKGKLGELIANNTVTIVDNALYPGGFSTRAFDSEGYPSQKTVLIDKGKLNSLLHNTVTARKDGVKSTGNGTRSYKGSLSISSTNYYLEPGNVKENELFKNYDNIIEIVALQGMHSGANSISGDFSLSAEGFLYEKGKKKYSLKQFTVSGNILKLLNDVEAVADNFKFNMSSYGASSVLIKELVISG